MYDGSIFMTGDKSHVFANANKLTDIGLDVPQVTQLMNMLAARGVASDEGIYTVDGAFEFLKNKLRKN